jgi:hypothetical protein
MVSANRGDMDWDGVSPMLNFSWFRKAAICASLCLGSASAAQFTAGSMALGAEPAKFQAALSSADGLMKDMEFLTVTLAKQKAIYQKSIQPNIEIFLIGVNPVKPIGMSYLFDAETGQRMMMQIPVLALAADFIDGNLVPIGIDATKVKTDKTLYKLSGETLTGFMRAKGDNSYASISKKESDVPAGIKGPDETLNTLLSKGHDFVAFSENSEAEGKVRAEAFTKLKENRIAALKKNTNESQEAFDLKKLIIEQQVDSIGQLFAETKLIEMGWTTNADAKLGQGVSHWTALPNTDFAKWVSKLKEEKSVFGGLTPSEKAVFTARVNMPISETNLVNLSKVYAASPVVLRQQIEKETDLSEDEKKARIAVTETGLEALNKALETSVLDMHLEIAPSTDGKHSFVLGIRSIDNRASIEKLVDQLGKVRSGWSSKTNLEAVGETKFHSFTAANAPKTLLDFYGGDGTVYVAAGPEFVGFATGLGSLDVLKTVAAAAASGQPKALESFVDVRFHARETLRVNHAFMQEKDFDLLQIMKNFGFRRDKVEKSDEKAVGKKPAVGGGAAGKLSALKNFEWQQTAIDAMAEGDDLVTMQMKLVNDAIDSNIEMREGVLTGLGAVIAKFAKDNLN